MVKLKEEERRLISELPLSNFGAIRIPKQITADIVLGQVHKRKITRTKVQSKQHQLLKHFNTKGLAKNRFFNLDCNNPLSFDENVSDDSQRDSLRQFFGFESNSSERSDQINAGGAQNDQAMQASLYHPFPEETKLRETNEAGMTQVVSPSLRPYKDLFLLKRRCNSAMGLEPIETEDFRVVDGQEAKQL